MECLKLSELLTRRSATDLFGWHDFVMTIFFVGHSNVTFLVHSFSVFVLLILGISVLQKLEQILFNYDSIFLQI